MAWSEILSTSNPGNGGALIRVAVDTASFQRLGDGSYLVWLRTIHEKPLSAGGRPYNRRTSRFVLRCETPTDGRYKGVSTTSGLARFAYDPWVWWEMKHLVGSPDDPGAGHGATAVLSRALHD